MQNQVPTIPLLKDHLFIQSLEKEGQEWLRGESAIPAAPWGGQLELVAHSDWSSFSSQREEETGEKAGGERRDRGRGVEKERESLR